MTDHHTSQHLCVNMLHPWAILFQCKVDEIFEILPNVFSIADSILVKHSDSDSKDQDEMLWQVLQICRRMNLNLTENKCHFR